MPGPAVWRLSHKYDWSRMLISSCRESVKALATARGKPRISPSAKGAKSSSSITTPPADRASSSPGRPASDAAHCTAHGKSLLANFGLAELKALYGSTVLERCTARTRMSLPELAKACAQVRADSCSIDDGGTWRTSAAWPPGPRSGRAGVRLDRVSGPAPRMSKGRDVVLAQHVCDTAEHINSLLRT